MVMERAVHQNRPNEVDLDQPTRDSVIRVDGQRQTPASIARQLVGSKKDLGAKVSASANSHSDPARAQHLLKSIDSFIAALHQRARDIADGKVAPPTGSAPIPTDETHDDSITTSVDETLLRHDTTVLDREAVIAAVADVDSLVDAQVSHDAVPPDIEPDVEAQVLSPSVTVDAELHEDELQEQLVDTATSESPPAKVEPPPTPPRGSESPQSKEQDRAVTKSPPASADPWPTDTTDDGLGSDPFGRQSDVDEVVWSRDIELLYEDVIYLFQSSDTEGALISLERLLIVAPANEAIQEFVALNEKKLVDVYERLIGPWTKIPRRNVESKAMPTSYLRDAKIERIARLIDGKASVDEIFSKVRFGRLEVCCILSQLQRARLVQLVAPETIN